MPEHSEAAWFAGRLRELREAAGLTRLELAERAAMKLGGIRDLEQGVNKPSWESVLAICRALNVPCDTFRQPPAARPPAGPGRPRKDAAAGQAEASPPPKRRPGRRRKGG